MLYDENALDEIELLGDVLAAVTSHLGAYRTSTSTGRSTSPAPTPPENSDREPQDL
ncbi:MAG: hypothetical protein M3Q27_05830 [Actinomycetota bacterium]|nr:hypothetical protein [Actinomycetota bacterium]